MAIYHFVLVVAFTGIALNNIHFVHCADRCKTHADCKASYGDFRPYCCGGYLSFGSKDRRCKSGSCLYRYCSKDSDCGFSTLCCRSNKCVNKGCSGCTKNTDCYITHACCKKTSPLNQTICAKNCLDKACNFNDDCAGYGECCRSGKCTSNYKKCYMNKCTLNSECNQGQYCCRKKSTSYYSYNNKAKGCSKRCVGEICSSNEDCGPPNECCISNKCVDRGCSGCTTSSNCSTGQYCCKKRHWYELSECSDHCIGKSCNTNDDCGGPGEICDSAICLHETGKISVTIGLSRSSVSVKDCNTKCSKNSFSSSSPKILPPKSVPPWIIAFTTVSLVVFLGSIAILLAGFLYMKRKRSSDAAQVGPLPQENIQYQAGAEIVNQPNAKLCNLSNPIYHDLEVESQNPGTVIQNGEGNKSFQHYHNQGYKTAMSSDPTQPEDVQHHHNEMHDPVYHTLESQDVPQDTQSSYHIYKCPIPKK